MSARSAFRIALTISCCLIGHYHTPAHAPSVLSTARQGGGSRIFSIKARADGIHPKMGTRSLDRLRLACLGKYRRTNQSTEFGRGKQAERFFGPRPTREVHKGKMLTLATPRVLVRVMQHITWTAAHPYPFR